MAYEPSQPLYISSGSLLTPKEVSGNRYTFEHISLNGIPVIECPPGITPNNANGNDTETFFPQNLETAICFQRIGDLFNGKITDGVRHTEFIEKDYDSIPFFNNIEELENKHCAFITPNGTISPQILYCWDFGVNQISLSTDEDNAAKWSEADGNKSYHWVAQVPEQTEDSENNKTSEELKKALQVVRHFGIQQVVAETRNATYISILGRHPLIDPEGKFERTYISNFPPTGAFAILLDIPFYEADSENKNPPQVSFQFLGDETSSNFRESSDVDNISITVVPNGNTTVRVDENSFSDSLNFTQLGTKIVHTNSSALSSKNVIFVYSLMNSLVVTGDLNTAPNNKLGTKHIIVKKHKDIDLTKKTTPPLNEYPSKHKSGNADEIELSSKDLYINFGNRIKADWKNCIGSFAIAALRFCPVVKFSYFFKVGGEKTNPSVNNTQSQGEDYFYLEYGSKSNKYKRLSKKQYSKFVSYDSDTQVSTYRVDFEISATNKNELQLYPFEIFGLIHVTKRSGKLTEVLNGDGDFSKGFNKNIESNYKNYIGNNNKPNTGNDWFDFITSVNVSHGLDGTSGSITVDKYMMMDISKKPLQSIGALTLIANNGFYKENGTTANGIEYTHERKYYPELQWGQIFKGYGLEISDNVSESNSQMTIKLLGIQKKLSDMKLVNCPYWDGDVVFSEENQINPDAVLSYMISYSGCDLKYVKEFSDPTSSVDKIILPRSWDWQSPSTNFVLGTTVLDAIKDIAKKINHQFVIQPDGRGYFYHMNDYGYPTWVDNGPIVMEYDEEDIISMDITPYIENRFNTFLTLGLLVKNGSGEAKVVPDGCKPGMKFSGVHIRDDDYPWSRIITNREAGLLTINDLEKFHKTNVKFGSSDIYQGTISVPGFHDFFIFDKIKIGKSLTFYITGINHNINLQTKEWTTSLSIASFESGKPKTDDMEM